MRKFSLHLTALLLLLTNPLPATASSSMQEVAKVYEVYFRELIADRDYPGAAFAIVSRTEVLHIATAGHTTAARKQPIDTQTTFRLASVSIYNFQMYVQMVLHPRTHRYHLILLYHL